MTRLRLISVQGWIGGGRSLFTQGWFGGQSTPSVVSGGSLDTIRKRKKKPKLDCFDEKGNRIDCDDDEFEELFNLFLS